MSQSCKDLTRSFIYHSHNLHFKITLSSGRIHPCKDQVYSHNLHFKITLSSGRIHYCYIIQRMSDSHNLHFKITLSSGRIHPCKDQVYSHNLHFKLTEGRQDTLLLYNPKECRERKKKFAFLPQDPSLLGDP